jgi:hypothetical protein
MFKVCVKLQFQDILSSCITSSLLEHDLMLLKKTYFLHSFGSGSSDLKCMVEIVYKNVITVPI